MQALDITGRLGIKAGDPESLPFSINDTTAGSESELQVAVKGSRHQVDLPRYIEESNYYANAMRRMASGDTNKTVVQNLDRFLTTNSEGIWENSWVRFPLNHLRPLALKVLDNDLKSDKANTNSCYREDKYSFLIQEKGESYLRIPVSYLLKLSLADVIHPLKGSFDSIYLKGISLMNHFVSDNASPETYSTHVVDQEQNGIGSALARETAKRFLLTHFLVQYANEKFGLRDSGQEAMVFFSPTPPLRMKYLNECISDTFYRELFLSPCLSGWNFGEKKHAYMGLCHEVLSRSQLNAIIKLREAGIITRNLVILPNTSSTSLSNNGTHITLGSNKLTQARRDNNLEFGPAQEKFLGDLVTKIFEHFMPLFVGTYSAAPTRLAFTDFHPEKALGYLPHQLDYTHLRMIWRRWKKKASNSFIGKPLTPFGPELLDRFLSRLLNLKGDFIPDLRLIDYLVSLLSTQQSPALNGSPQNTDRLKRDLQSLGVFDERMSMYLLLKQRQYDAMGFSGFEGRYYSLFERFQRDMAPATNLQRLLLALCYTYIANGEVTHEHIPDGPEIESERRQIFFGAAIGLPTFYVNKSTSNQFIRRILKKTRRTRSSRRYPGYLRIYVKEYQLALLQIIREDVADLIELFKLKDTLSELESRLQEPHVQAAFGRINRQILEGKAPHAMQMIALEYNQSAENFYRNTLKKKHLEEALTILEKDVSQFEPYLYNDSVTRALLEKVPCNHSLSSFLKICRKGIIEENLQASSWELLIQIWILLENTIRPGTQEKVNKLSESKYAGYQAL